MSELTPKTQINNRYVLLEHKGSGSFGEVWLAHDQILNQQIALKIYISLDPRGVEEFKAEYNLAIGLSHPNLLTATYLDVWQQRPFLVMKYCANGSSSNLAGKIDEHTLIRFIHDVASGLHYLHGLPDPIIHQDIKPDNILMDEDGMFLITDFGISKKIRSTMRKLSSRSIGAGATAYMGPERFEANPTPIKASDIWSLGASIYEMATGELPFSGMGGGMQRNGADMPSLDNTWSPAINQLMQACMAQETWDRPTASQIEVYTTELMEGKTPQITWRESPAEKQPSAIPPTDKSQEIETDSSADNIVYDSNDSSKLNLHHYKELKGIVHMILITGITLLLLTGVLGAIAVNQNTYPSDTVIIGIINSFVLFWLGKSAINSLKRHQPNAIFKVRVFYAATFFYWLFISIVSNTFGLFKILIIALCIKGFRMISNSIEIEQLFPKTYRHHGVKGIFTLLLAFLLPMGIELSPIFLGSLMYDEGPQPVNTEVTQPRQKSTKKPQKKQEKVVIERVYPGQKESEYVKIPVSDQPTNALSEDAEKLERSLKNKDYQTVQRLANDGYTPAYVPLARFYLNKNDYDDANHYAQKAKKAGQPGAQEIIQLLTNLGYYD